MPLSLAITEVQRELVSEDPSTAEPSFDDLYGARLRIDMPLLDGRRTRVSHHHMAGDGYTLETLVVDGDLEIQGDGPSNVFVSWIVTGRVESQVRDAISTAGPGEVVVGSTGTAPFRMRISDAELKTVILDQSLLDRVIADSVALSGSVRPLPYLVSRVPHSAGKALLWTRTHTYVAETMAAGDIDSPLVSANCGRLLALTALAVFGTHGAQSTVARHGDGEGPPEYPVMLRRAMDYIESHARYDVGVNDIAAAIYLTPRALQYMFRKHLDVTPMAYLRRIRLEHVHAELVRSSRRTTTVSTAAARWGFAHTGRFAVLYRETYGRSPHVTLRE